MEGCIGKLFKFLLVTVNILLLLMGLVLLGIGIFAYQDGKTLSQLVDSGSTAIGSDFTINLYGVAAIAIMVISGIIVIVSFFGCCGAWKENRCLLFFNYVCILVPFIGVIAGATIAFTQSIDIIRNPMISSLSQYNVNASAVTEENKAVTEAWDNIQEQFTCCGVDDYSDWTNKTYNTEFPTKEKYLVPPSCCTKYDNQEDCRIHPDVVLKRDGIKGCFTLLYHTLGKNKYAISIGTTTIIVFMFINLLAIFTYVMCLVNQNSYHTLA